MLNLLMKISEDGKRRQTKRLTSSVIKIKDWKKQMKNIESRYRILVPDLRLFRGLRTNRSKIWR